MLAYSPLTPSTRFQNGGALHVCGVPERLLSMITRHLWVGIKWFSSASSLCKSPEDRYSCSHHEFRVTVASPGRQSHQYDLLGPDGRELSLPVPVISPWITRSRIGGIL